MQKKRSWLRLVLPLGLIVLAGWVFLHRQNLQDQIVLARYDPPARIEALAEGADLSQHGKNLFFVNQPELHDKATFNQVCHGLGDEQSNVLGCFNGSRIYIYDVPSERLDGVEEVTAAHEMLHAAYMRLSGSEKDRVDSLLQQQLETNVDPHVRELIGVYERLEPGQLLNEMHSILATEQRELLPELESYFDQYFDDRQTVVTLSAEYRAVFESLKQQQEALARELDQLAESINSGTASLNQRIDSYNATVEAFNERARSGTMTEEEYDRERVQLEAEKSAIDAAIATNETLRRQYEQKLQEFDALAIDFAELQNTIDSSPARPEGVQ